MHVTLTNLGTEDVPVTSSQGNGYAAMLHPGHPHTVSDADVTVLTVGDNPTFAEDLREALESVAALARRLIAFWKEHTPKDADAGKPIVRVRIVAGESNSLRVTGDDRNADTEVTPGALYDAQAVNYVEIRQLGV